MAIHLIIFVFLNLYTANVKIFKKQQKDTLMELG